MRKSLGFTFFLFLLSTAILCGSYGWVNQAKDDVVIEESVVYGDKSAAEGIAVTNRTTCDYHLFWNTVYRVGGDLSVSTTFTFSQARLEERNRADQPALSLYSNTDFGISGNNLDLEAEHYSPETAMKPVIAVAERTPAGGTREETVFLRDYYEFYPLTLDMDIQDTRLAMNQEIRLAFADYLRIPIDPGHQVKISVTKDDEGNIIEVNSSTVSGWAELSAASAATDSGCYFALSAVNDQGVAIPLPAELSGIHYLPFEKKGEFLLPAVGQMRLVYPLDQRTRVLHLGQSAGSRLLLLTRKDRAATLSVIDQETRQLLQKIPLLKGREEVIVREIQQKDSYLLPIFSDGSFSLLTDEPESGYKIQLSGNLFAGEGLDPDLPYYDLTADYDGRRLAVAFYQYHRQWDDSLCRTYLLVYGREGLIYAGQYDHSADRTLTPGYRERVRLLDQGPVTVSFN